MTDEKHSFEVIEQSNRGEKLSLSSWLLFILVSISGCSDVAERNLKPWETASNTHFNLYPIVHLNNVILPSNCNGQNCLKAVNKHTGKTSWEWVDTNGILQKAYYNLSSYISSNVLILPISEDLIAIDLTNGKTLWHSKKKYAGESFVDGLGNNAVRTYYDKAEKVHKVFLIDMITGNMREIKRFDVPKEGKKFVRTPCLIKDEESSDTICVTSVIEYDPVKLTKNHLLFWILPNSDFQRNMEIYRENKNGDGVTKQCITDKSRSYWVANNEVVCVDILNQAELWRTEMKKGMLTSRLMQDDKYLFYACEDENLYALDKENGNIIWERKIAGTPSRVFINREILYLVGGSDGHLYMVNKNTGQLISSQKIPYHNINAGKFLRRTLYAGMDILILNDGQNWHCYPLSQDKPFVFNKARLGKEE